MTSGGLIIEGVSLEDFQRVTCEPEPTHECGLAIRDPLEWHWHCSDCGHDEHDGFPCDMTHGVDHFLDHECPCASRSRVLTLRPRQPFRGSVPRRIEPTALAVADFALDMSLALVSDVAGKKGMGHG